MAKRHVAILSHSRHDFPGFLGDAPEVSLHLFTRQQGGPKEGYAQVHEFPGFLTNGAVEHAVIRAHQATPFHAIVAVTEFEVLRAARLRAYLGIPGQSVESALAYRDKLVMKERLRAANLPTDPFCDVIDPSGVVAFADRHGYPFVLKPRMGGGANGLRIIRSEEALKAALAAPFYGPRGDYDYYSGGYMAESFIAGDLYHVNGLVIEGRLSSAWVFKYHQRCDEFLEGQWVGDYMIDPADPLAVRLTAYTQDVVAAFPALPAAVVHAEVFRHPSGDFRLCEIAARPSGVKTCEVIAYATGIHLVREHVRAQALGEKEAQRAAAQLSSVDTVRLGAQMHFPLRQGLLRRVPQDIPFEWVWRYQLEGRKDQRYALSENIMESLASVLLEGRGEAQFSERMQQVSRWIERETQWEP
jgi:hypothetical protein